MSEETWHGGAPTLHRTRTTSPMHRCARDAKPFKDPAGAVSWTRTPAARPVPVGRPARDRVTTAGDLVGRSHGLIAHRCDL
jgi:hypothetical protein